MSDDPGRGLSPVAPGASEEPAAEAPKAGSQKVAPTRRQPEGARPSRRQLRPTTGGLSTVKPGGKPKGPDPGSTQNPGIGELNRPDNCGDRFGIDSVDAQPPLEPGEKLTVQGCGFGAGPGELRLLGDFPGGHLSLDVSFWSQLGNSAIVAKVPMVTGVGDVANVKLQVVTSTGRSSNWWDVGEFRATRETRRILPQDLLVRCGAPGPRHDGECSHAAGGNAYFQNASFGAQHEKSVPGRDPDDCSAVSMLGQQEEHTDTAEIHLQNGWVISDYKWWFQKTRGTAWVEAPQGVVLGQPSATLAMKWGLSVTACGGPHRSGIRYKVELYAQGPKGVPYK